MTILEKDVVDVLIVGAGPSGTLASALLKQQGVNVLVLEKQQFPRFSIGESLLPHLMVFLEKAGLADTVNNAGYQKKNGASFRRGDRYTAFNFEDKFTPGPGTTFQVKRAEFDKRLADEVESMGVPIRYRHEVLAVDNTNESCLITAQGPEGKPYNIEAGFVLDASGFGRVLPRLLKLETPSDFPVRQSIFCHIKDNITDPSYDRQKILISVHPENEGVWYWLIPFSDGTCSLGVVGSPEFFDGLDGSLEDKMLACRLAEPAQAKLLDKAEFITDVRQISGFSSNVKALYGKNFALLGNAGEFLDPVFSSGVTIAFKSADLATNLLLRRLAGEKVCWETEYSQPLKKGVDTFRVFVDAWYDGRLQDIIFHQDVTHGIQQKICSILAGYAWDESNPYVAKPERRINVLAELCRTGV